MHFVIEILHFSSMDYIPTRLLINNNSKQPAVAGDRDFYLRRHPQQNRVPALLTRLVVINCFVKNNIKESRKMELTRIKTIFLINGQSADG